MCVWGGGGGDGGGKNITTKDQAFLAKRSAKEEPFGITPGQPWRFFFLPFYLKPFRVSDIRLMLQLSR